MKKKLAVYLKEFDGGIPAFAKAVKVKRAAVDKWLRGDRRPRCETARLIEKVTGGEITLQDIYG
jgi:DNA-binding transcriptional regulator YdaS (Cro superfamily)